VSLGLIDAALGRKEEDALREGRRAVVELCPIGKDALRGIAMIKYLADDCCVGWRERYLACEQLAIAIRRPDSLSYGQLKLMPFLGSVAR